MLETVVKRKRGVTLTITKRQARKLLKALDQVSVDDEEMSNLYYKLKFMLEAKD